MKEDTLCFFSSGHRLIQIARRGTTAEGKADNKFSVIHDYRVLKCAHSVPPFQVEPGPVGGGGRVKPGMVRTVTDALGQKVWAYPGSIEFSFADMPLILQHDFSERVNLEGRNVKRMNIQLRRFNAVEEGEINDKGANLFAQNYQTH